MSDRYCLNCGSIVPQGLKYCPVCGSPINNGNDKNQKKPDLLADGLHLEEDSIPVPKENVERTQQLDLNSIRLSEPSIPDFNEKPENELDTPAETRRIDDPSEKQAENKHGKLYSAFIEDEDEEDDSGYDDEERPSHTGLIVTLIILAALAAAGAWIYIKRPAFITSLLHRSSSTPEETTSVPEVTPEPSVSPVITEQPVENGIIGTVTIEAESINIRNAASTSGAAVGTIGQGETRDVYETTENDGYTWYRIGEDEWIADGGGWTTYTANQ